MINTVGQCNYCKMNILKYLPLYYVCKLDEDIDQQKALIDEMHVWNS